MRTIGDMTSDSFFVELAIPVLAELMPFQKERTLFPVSARCRFASPRLPRASDSVLTATD
jgi:hypothetical protein